MSPVLRGRRAEAPLLGWSYKMGRDGGVELRRDRDEVLVRGTRAAVEDDEWDRVE